MEEPSDAGSIPASSINYHEEGPAEGGRSPDDAQSKIAIGILTLF